VRKLVTAAVLAVSVAVGAAPAGSRAATTAVVSFRSRALDSRLHFLVHLPPDYARGHRRYPVVYFLHGLPAGPDAYRGVAWIGDALDANARSAILVMPQGTKTESGDPEYHDWGPGENWETALASELPAYVDAHFRTIASREGRAILGLSAGGYGAAILGLHHPGEYGAIESWSGYFRPTDPTGSRTLDVGSDADNARASVHALVPSLRSQFSRLPTYLAFYVGRSDPTFVGDNEALARELTAARVPHVFRRYPGGHSTALWQAHARTWLAMALDHLQAATNG
jgi:enterochelin esterase-like enzyme